MRTVVLPEGVPDVSACVLSLCLGAMKRRADAVGPATRQSARHQKMQATAGAAVREPAPQEDPEQLLRARRAARDARQRSRQLQAGTAAARDAAAGADGSDSDGDAAEEERNESEDEELAAGYEPHNTRVCTFCGIACQGKRPSKRGGKGGGKGLQMVLCRRTQPAPLRPSMRGFDGAPSEKYFPKVRPNGARILLPGHDGGGHWACAGDNTRCAERNRALIEAERERPPPVVYPVDSPAVSSPPASRLCASPLSFVVVLATVLSHSVDACPLPPFRRCSRRCNRWGRLTRTASRRCSATARCGWRFRNTSNHPATSRLWPACAGPAAICGSSNPMLGWTMQCASCENRVPCAPCREQLDPHERLTLALLSGVDLGNWRGNGWTRDRIYHALGKRQLQRHTRTQDAFGALVAVRIWPDDEVAGLSVDAPLPYNTSTLLPDLVQLLLKVLLAEEYAGDDQPWDTDDMVYYPNDMAVSDHDAEEDGGDDNDVAVRGLEDEAQTMQH